MGNTNPHSAVLSFHVSDITPPDSVEIWAFDDADMDTNTTQVFEDDQQLPGDVMDHGFIPE